LIGSLGAEHVIEFAVENATTPIEIDALRALDGVRAARSLAVGYELQVSALHLTVPSLLALVARHGGTLTQLTTHSASLEDVFVSLTGRQLRDE
jgi:ABC-2 type transport system ATP-binding protein